MGIIYAYINGVEQYVGEETHNWNSKTHVFLWLMLFVEMLILGPKHEKSGEQDKTTNKCVARRLHTFRFGHIQQLSNELQRICSSKPKMAHPPTHENADKLV